MFNRSLLSWQRAASGLLAVALAATTIGCAVDTTDGQPAATGTVRSGLSRAATQRLRLLTWNTWQTAGPFVGTPPIVAQEQALRIKYHADGFDIVLLNELWDANDRQQYLNILSSKYPYAITDIAGAGTDATGSGLLVLSRLPFVEANYENPGVPWQQGTVSLVAPAVYKQAVADRGYEHFFRFEEFRSGNRPDSYAAKGALMFHVESGGRRYNIVATHMQSGASSSDVAIRDEQFVDLGNLIRGRINVDLDEETIIGGDLNVDAVNAGWPIQLDSSSPSSQFLSSEYRQTIWGGMDGEPFFDTWRTTSQKDRGITNNLGDGDDVDQDDPTKFVGPHRYDYFLVRGGRYHSPGALTWQNGSAFMNASGDPRCVNWVRNTLRASSSDHFGVAMEMGPRAENCNPALARRPNPDGNPILVTIPSPGANVWLYYPAPGTYTLGFASGEADAGLKYEVFAEDNLSRGLTALPNHEEEKNLPTGQCGGEHPCAYVTNRFSTGLKGFYVRIYSPDGKTYGTSNFLALRHDCASREYACELTPGAAGFQPIMPINQLYTGHFTFNTMRTVNSEVPQTLKFDATTTTAGYISMTVTRDGTEKATAWDTAVSDERKEAKAVEYLLQISRSADQVAYEVKASTNLTWVSGAKDDVIASPSAPQYTRATIGMKLVCQNENGANFLGDEEISAQIVADGIPIAGPPLLFRDDLDAMEAMDMSAVPDFGFVESAKIVVNDHRGDHYYDTIEDSATHELTKLSPSESDGQQRQEAIQLRNVVFGTNGPLMQYQYYISHGRAH